MQKRNRNYRNEIILWTFLGLFIRVIFMPFTMHGQDSLFMNYFPMRFITEGLWDPYGLINAEFPQFPYTYYGPVLFLIMSAVNFVYIKILHIAPFLKMLKIAGPMLFGQFTTVDYVRAFSSQITKPELYGNLFLAKAPFLLFDFLIAFLLLKLSRTREQAIKVYKLWMLNFVAIYSTYMVGGFDLVPAFFITMALFCATIGKPYLAVIALSIGGSTKLFPFLLVLPTCFLMGREWKKKLSLIITGTFATAILILPFYLSSKGAIFRFFLLSGAKQYGGAQGIVLMGIFAVLYIAIMVNAVKDSQKPNPHEKLFYYILAIGFLSYAVTPISFRYFVFITPLLAILISKNTKFGLYTLLMLFLLAFLRLPYSELQLGLFIPLDPEKFGSLPAFQDIVGRFVNINVLYKLTARIMALCFFGASWWIWRMRASSEKELI